MREGERKRRAGMGEKGLVNIYLFFLFFLKSYYSRAGTTSYGHALDLGLQRRLCVVKLHMY